MSEGSLDLPYPTNPATSLVKIPLAIQTITKTKDAVERRAKFFRILNEAIQILFAVLLASIGLKAFLLPNGFLDGGVTGIAILLSQVLNVKMSLLLPLVSLPFFLIGAVTVTRRIVFKSALSILVLSAFMYFENFQSLTDDKLIISIFGGLFLGAGIGLAIRNGSVLDGSELIGIYLHERYGLSIGTIILGFNVVLFGVTALILTPEIAMYSTLTYFVTSKAIDFTIQGFENYAGLMIVSEQSEAIRAAFVEKIGPGITVYQGIRGYGKRGENHRREIIHVVINRIDAKRAERLIERIDPAAFVIEFDVNNVKGGVVRRFLRN